MSNNKKDAAKHVAATGVNNVAKTVKRTEQVQKSKDKGDVIIKWIFGVLIVLAILYMIWSFTMMQ